MPPTPLWFCAACNQSLGVAGAPPAPPGPCPACGGPLCAPAAAQTLPAPSAAATMRVQPAPGAGHETSAMPYPTVLASDADRTILRSGIGATAASVPEAASGRLFGRYRLLQALGAGGMGVVWKAWDTELQRVVALKQIKGEEFAGGEEPLERFQREARLAAKLHHPNIVGVHDVGVAEGQHFLTMDYVEGRTYAALLDETRAGKRAGSARGLERLRPEVAVLADVAGAVAYAHEQGVIHRDLKPGNVLVTAHGAPFVMDFGLAKEIVRGGGCAPGPRSARALTVSGQVMGTPAYMSPEQAQGDMGRIGVGSDVWALGAILYEILTGETPFERAGQPWDILGATVKEEPTPPRARNPHAPAELEAVALRALEKDPARRYRTARDLEAELRRWLRGEPVEARRASLSYRLWRRAVRHRVSVATAAILLTALAVAAAARFATARAQQEAARLHAEVIEQLRGTARLCLDETLVARRKGDLSARDRLRPRLEEAYQRARERLVASDPEPDFLLGRMLRAGLDDAAAIRAQDRALAIDPDFAPALYERAILSGREYRARRLQARDAALARLGAALGAAGQLKVGGLGGGVVRTPTDAELEASDPQLRQTKDAAVALLRRLTAILGREGGGVRSPGNPWRTHREPALRVGEGKVACLQGMLASFTAARGTEVVQSLEQAVRSDPLLEEAYELLAQVAEQRGDYAAAVEACTRGIAADRGYLPHWNNRGCYHLDWGQVTTQRGGDPRPLYEQAVADFDAALALDPGHAKARAWRASVRNNLAGYLSSHGEDPGAQYDQAIADLDAVLKNGPGDADPLMRRAGVRLNWGHALAQRGGDPKELFAQAIADLDAALRLRPGYFDAVTNRALARIDWGHQRMSRGEDPGELFGQAIADLDGALRLDPSRSEALRYRALARLNWSRYQDERGTDPGDLLGQATADLDAAVKLNPGLMEERMWRAAVRINWANSRSNRGEDPEGLYTLALADADAAVALDPGSSDALLTRATVPLNWALCKMRRGEDPNALCVRALADLDAALKLNPACAEALSRRAETRLNWGHYRMGRGQEADRLFAEAIADADAALRLNATLVAAFIDRAAAQVDWSNLKADAGQEPGPLCVQAIADYDAALKLDPTCVEAFTGRAIARVNWGNAKAKAGQDPEELYAQGVADHDAALRLNPASADAHLNRARARLNWGRHRSRRGQDPGEFYARSIADYDAALRLHPGLAEALMLRAIVRSDWGLYRMERGEEPGELFRSALADFDAALRLDPASVDALVGRATLQVNWGNDRGRRGGSPGPLYGRSIEDLDAALRLNPAQPDALLARAGARVNWALDQAGRGVDPGAHLAAAIADCDAALKSNPAYIEALVHRASARLNWAAWRQPRHEEIGELCTRAFDDLNRALALNPASAEAHWRRGLLLCAANRWAEALADFDAATRVEPGCERNFSAQAADARAKLAQTGAASASSPEWLTRLRRGDAALEAGDFAAAAKAYAQGLAAVPESERVRALADPSLRQSLATARYNLACLLALASVGRDGPKTPPREVPPPEAARLRDQAFEQLQGALDFGYADAGHLQADADLEPLRTDPRWEGVIRALGK